MDRRLIESYPQHDAITTQNPSYHSEVNTFEACLQDVDIVMHGEAWNTIDNYVIFWVIDFDIHPRIIFHIRETKSIGYLASTRETPSS